MQPKILVEVVFESALVLHFVVLLGDTDWVRWQYICDDSASATSTGYAAIDFCHDRRVFDRARNHCSIRRHGHVH